MEIKRNLEFIIKDINYYIIVIREENMSFEAYLIHHKLPIIGDEVEFIEGGVILKKSNKNFFVPFCNINFIRSKDTFKI